ncbi:MAG: hypothetical protein LBJ92_01710 [Holosporales bacterium]|nr:hypothetical protein [Holosporales bacterium]
MFIIGIVCSMFLFFISGTLVGYSVCDKVTKCHDAKNGKPPRAPKPDKTTTRLMPMPLPSRHNVLTPRIRTPSHPAIAMAQAYRPRLTKSK